MHDTNVRHLRRVAPPLAGYMRVGHRDAALVAKLLDQGLPAGAGVIIDPMASDRTAHLRTVAVQNGVEAILDPKSVELSTIGGMGSRTVSSLPWAAHDPHVPSALVGPQGDAVAAAIAANAIEQGATGVLAPTHFLDLDRSWLEADAELTERLRHYLDTNGAKLKVIYYPLVASLKVLRDPTRMSEIKASLRSLIARRQVDGIFLRVQGFGTTKAGPRNLRSYIAACRELHDLGVPLVGERTGTVGVALAAFGAVGGVESAVTHGDAYDARRLLEPPSGSGFVPPPRVYLEGALFMLPVADAAALLSRHGFGRFGCQQACCHRGRQATIDDPRRHFVVVRAAELSRLSTVPDTDRAEAYITTTLAPARDNAAQLARTVPALAKQRDRLDDWYLTLRRLHQEDVAIAHTTALAPTGRRLAMGA